VAGLGNDCGPDDRPWITSIYTKPNYGSHEPPTPLPPWLCGMLIRLAVAYHTFREAIADLNDWGLLTDIKQYREANNHIMSAQEKLTYMTMNSKGSSITATSLKGGLKGLMQGKGSNSSNTLLHARVGTPLGGPTHTFASGGTKDEDVLSEEGGGVTGGLNEYWACEFYDGKLAHNRGPCNCLHTFSGMF